MVDDTGRVDTVEAVEQPAGTRPSLPGYQLGMVIGQGGMGEVVVARDPKIGREVAIKRMKATSPTPDAIERFLREAKVQARLDHPAIVPVHELGHDSEGRPYFTMKRLAGKTMAEVLEHGGQQQRLVRALVDVCLAIELAHTRHIVHRDLKPANIMLGDYGEVYVLDWGIARVLDEAGEDSGNTDLTATPEGLTRAGVALGTPGYMAPETLAGEAIGPAADVYALGCVLFEILTGAPLPAPHGRTDDSSSVVTTIIANPTVAPSSLAPDRAIPPELDAACVAALSHDPAARPSARSLGERIQRYLDGDRDLERRRELGAVFLSQANAATGHADRMRLAGRALALDPESEQAAALVTRMMLEPPDEIPPDLERSIQTREVYYVARSSWFAVGASASLFLFLPVLLWMRVTNVPVLVGLYLLIALLVMLTYVQARSAVAGRRVNVYPSFICIMVVAATLSRICGPFLLVPLAVIATAVSILTQPQMLRRPVVGIAICVTAFVAPLVLEALGVLGATWHVDQDQFVFRSTMVHLGGVASEVLVIAAPIVSIVLAGVLSWALAVARRDALEQLELQSWRLMQLVPESVRR
jgi:serine/threonine-protein kinase